MSSIGEDMYKEEERYKELLDRKSILEKSYPFCPFCGNWKFEESESGGDAVGNGIFVPHAGNPPYPLLICRGCHSEFLDDDKRDGREIREKRVC